MSEHLRAHRIAFSISGSILEHLEGSVWLFTVAELFSNDFQTTLHFADDEVRSSFSISLCHYHELTPSTAYHEYSIHPVQHTPRTVYTECSIHQVQCQPGITCHPIILLMTSWPVNMASISGVPPYWLTAVSQVSMRAQRSIHLVPLTPLWVNKQTDIVSAISAPPIAPLQIDYHLVDRGTHSFRASKSAWSRPPSESPNTVHHYVGVHLQVDSITALDCISKHTRSRPPHSHNHVLRVPLQICLNTASECISDVTWSQPPSAYANSLDPGLQVYLSVPMITESQSDRCVHPIIILRHTSNCSQAPAAASADIPCVDG